MRTIIAALLATLTATAPSAEERTIELKRAPGLAKVEGHCGACHSLDYIEMNSPFLSPASCDAEVTKMIKVLGAPIEDTDAKIIADYLKANYGG
jgi:mono/diheme cytochrome c family protein